jgi:putative oxidoreductase
MKTENRFKKIVLRSEDDNKLIFIRLIVGLVFVSEGIQKYLFLQVLGPGLFTEMGFRHAFFWAYLTGAFEICCGVMILLGLLTRLASIPLLIVMIVAFLTTKLPILITKGFWSFVHEYNIDFSLTVLLVLLLIYGGGRWSMDINMIRSKKI